MNRRITLWMLIGLSVACCWAVIGILTGPTYNLGHSTLVAITAPASFLGRKRPLGVAWFVLLNGGLCALLGLAVDLVRRVRLHR